MKKAVAISLVASFGILLSVCSAMPAKSIKAANSSIKNTAKTSALNYKNSAFLHLTSLSTGSILEMGSTGSDVVTLQTNLTNLGYDTYGADGYFGQNTYNAVVAFQNDHGLTADGIVGPNTQSAIDSALNSSTILKMGCSGEAVIQLQTNLTNLGYSTYGVDGIFGTNTYNAVTWFQSDHGLAADGEVGPETQNAIDNAVNASSSSSDYLQMGSTGDAVVTLQTNLTNLGYDTYGADGDFGQNTYNAVYSFQSDHGLDADGVAGPLTQNAITAALNAANSNSSSNSLQMGSTGDAVAQLQTNLTSLGYSTNGIDGDFGQNTYNAVAAFQSAHGLDATGVADSNTLDAIDTALASIASTSSDSLQMGSTGSGVYQLQSNLTELGYSTNGVDGDFGQNTYNAVVSFQSAHNLTANGVVDTNTQTAITDAINALIASGGSSYSIAFSKAVNITMHYEGSGYAAISGNFDGQGLSLGALQWCIGQGSLQPLLRRMDNENTALTQEIFGDNYYTFHDMLSGTQSDQMNWAYSINSSSDNIVDPWRTELYNLCQTAQFQQIQRDAMETIASRAMNICNTYGLNTERGFALSFDIATQNGTVISSAANEIWGQISTSTAERTKLRVIAQAVADTCNQQWYSDVLSRKMTIANGYGTVHGEYLNLDTMFGLSDNNFR